MGNHHLSNIGELVQDMRDKDRIITGFPYSS